MAAVVLPAFLTASLAVQIRRDFEFSDAEVGLAVAGSYITAAAASSLAGRLVDGRGARSAIRAASALAALCALLVAGVVDSAEALIFVLLLAGLANALAAPGVSALIGNSPQTGRRGITLGMQQAGAPAGALLAGLALPLIALPFGWRWAFAGAAALSLAAGVAVRSVPRVAARAPDACAVQPRPPRLEAVRLLALAACLANLAAAGMLSFLVIYAVQGGLSEWVAGLLLAGCSLAAALARICFGALADARPGSALTIVSWLLALGAIGYLLLAAGQPAAIAAGAVVAGGIGWGWPGLMVLAIMERNRDATGAAVGVGMTGVYAGAAGGPLVAGLISEAASFRTAWLVTAGLALSAAALAVTTIRIDRAVGAEGGDKAHSATDHGHCTGVGTLVAFDPESGRRCSDQARHER
ncbi:MAG: MFS transporter [Thermoleophilaceae bacterium]